MRAHFPYLLWATPTAIAKRNRASGTNNFGPVPRRVCTLAQKTFAVSFGIAIRCAWLMALAGRAFVRRGLLYFQWDSRHLGPLTCASLPRLATEPIKSWGIDHDSR